VAGLNANRNVEIDRDEIRVDDKSLAARLADRVNQIGQFFSARFGQRESALRVRRD